MYHNNKPSSFDNSITVTPIKMEISSYQPGAPASTGAVPKETSKAAKVPKSTTARRPPPTLDNFWPNVLLDVRNIQQVDAKHQALPLARIKKIMKLDENAKMIAAEAPLLFAKACEYFIQELTMRAWIHTEESKRRTLQRSDIAQAIANYDQFDFLIDIVPREDIKPSTSSGQKKEAASSNSNATSATSSTATATTATAATESVAASTTNVANVNLPTNASTTTNILKLEQPEMLSYGIITPDTISAAQQAQQVQTHAQPASHQQLQIIQQPAATTHAQPMQYLIAIPGAQGQTQLVQQLQIPQQIPSGLGINLVPTAQPQQLILTTGPNGQLTATPAPTQQQQQTALIQNLAAIQQQQQQQQHQQQQQQQQQQQHYQLLQQVMTPTGEITNVPITINASQLNTLRLQLQQQQQQQQQHQQQHHGPNVTNIYLATAPAATQPATNTVTGERNLNNNNATFRPNC